MQKLNFDLYTSRKEVFEAVRNYVDSCGFTIADEDDQRPWGGFFVIEESQTSEFISTFFPHLSLSDFEGYRKLSPKFLMVAPGQRLSWQYHHRRSEIWKVIGGAAAVAVIDNDDETEPRLLPEGTVVELEKGQRHRLIGVDQWGIVAEIWRHTDPSHPSDENDIVRVQDDFGR